MTFHLMIKCDGAAFGEDEDSRAAELSRLLGVVIINLTNDGAGLLAGATLFDSNGNACGEWSIANHLPLRWRG